MTAPDRTLANGVLDIARQYPPAGGVVNAPLWARTWSRKNIFLECSIAP